VWITTAASDTVTLNFSSIPATSPTPNQTYLKVIVDGGVPTTTLVSATTSLVLLASTTAATHTFRVEVQQCPTNQWTGANTAQVLNWTSISTGSAASTVAITGLNSGLMLVCGDSRATGSYDLASASSLTYPNSDFSQSSGRFIGNALGCEVASHVFPGTGWMVPAVGGYGSGAHGEVPAFFVPGSPSTSNWNSIYSGVSMAFPSNLNYVLVENFVNDALRGTITAAQVTSSVSGFLTALRAVIPTQCQILIALSWAGCTGSILNYATLNAAVTLGVTNYLTSSGDPLCWVIPINLNANDMVYAYNAGSNSTYWTGDGIHPYVIANAYIAAKTLQSIASLQGRLVPRVGCANVA